MGLERAALSRQPADRAEVCVGPVSPECVKLIWVLWKHQVSALAMILRSACAYAECTGGRSEPDRSDAAPSVNSVLQSTLSQLSHRLQE